MKDIIMECRCGETVTFPREQAIIQFGRDKLYHSDRKFNLCKKCRIKALKSVERNDTKELKSAWRKVLKISSSISRWGYSDETKKKIWQLIREYSDHLRTAGDITKARERIYRAARNIRRPRKGTRLNNYQMMTLWEANREKKKPYLIQPDFSPTPNTYYNPRTGRYYLAPRPKRKGDFKVKFRKIPPLLRGKYSRISDIKKDATQKLIALLMSAPGVKCSKNKALERALSIFYCFGKEAVSPIIVKRYLEKENLYELRLQEQVLKETNARTAEQVEERIDKLEEIEQQKEKIKREGIKQEIPPLDIFSNEGKELRQALVSRLKKRL